MARTGSKPTANKIDAEIKANPLNEKVPSGEINYMISKTISPGTAKAFSESITADDENVYPDQTMNGDWNFVKDASVVDNEGLLNGVSFKFTYQSGNINFTPDFDVIADTLEVGEKYLMVISWFGLSFLAGYKKFGDVASTITVLSATVENADPSTLVVVFSGNGSGDLTGLSLDGDWTGTTLDSYTGDGTNTWNIALGTPVVNAESGNLVYSVSNTIGLTAGSTLVTNNVAAIHPTITSVTISGDNTYADLVLSEGIYGANDGSTPAVLADLSIVFAQSGGTATNWVASSAKKNDNTAEGSASALTGGETTIRIFGTLSGVVDGNETLTVSPTDGASLYDIDGNAMDSGESVENNFIAGIRCYNALEGVFKQIRVDYDPIYDFDIGDPFSLAAWVWIDSSVGNASVTIITRHIAIAKGFTSYLLDGRAFFRLYESSSKHWRAYSNLLPTEEWVHLGFSYDGGIETGLKIYVNGVDDTLGYSGSGTPTNITDTDGVALAFTSEKMAYGESRIFDYELTAANFLSLYNSGEPAASQLLSPIGEWLFTQDYWSGARFEVIDSSVNGKDGWSGGGFVEANLETIPDFNTNPS